MDKGGVEKWKVVLKPQESCSNKHGQAGFPDLGQDSINLDLVLIWLLTLEARKNERENTYELRGDYWHWTS